MVETESSAPGEKAGTVDGGSRRSSWRRLGLLVVFNLGLFLLLAEVLALGAYLARTGKIYYLDPPTGRSIEAEPAGSVNTYRIHPYLGFIVRPDAVFEEAPVDEIPPAKAPSRARPRKYNNYGFESTVDYPYSRQGNEVLVGVLGGSVAAKLCGFERREGVLTRHLAETLGRDPGEIRVLSFAQGGFKQPQQVQILSYFLAQGQALDFLVTIDGFNEVALGALNQMSGLAAEMPSIEHIRALQELTSRAGAGASLEQMLTARVSFAAYRRAYNRAWGAEAWETRFAAGFLFDFLRYRLHWRRFANARLALTRAGSDRQGDPSWLYLEAADQPGEVDWPSVVGVWEGGARQLASTARSASLVAVHAIQPNQYFPTERRYSEADRALAIAERSPYRDLVPEGYGHLLERLSELEEEGLEVLDLVRLFDAEQGAVYEDNCCHYNDTGNALLARALGERLREVVRRSESRDGAEK